tara:strand:+ start:294 stop:995 length:702 start_codon:yes stop_codon:yes gene_type:complete
MPITLLPIRTAALMKPAQRFRWRVSTKLSSDGSLQDSQFQRDLQADIEAVLSRGITLQRGERRWISLVETADGPMVVKMFLERGVRHSVKRLFLRTRATIYTERAQQLAAAGISTPIPVATVAERCAWLVGNSCVVYRYAPGETLGNFVRSISHDESVLPEQKCRIVRHLRQQMVTLGERLAEIGLAHTDVHHGNFLVDKTHTIQLLDLDSLRPTRKRYRLIRSRQHFQTLVI